MEKQILIPIIVVLGLLTLGGVIAGIYLYRNKFMKKGVDVEGNLCDNDRNVVDSAMNKKENIIQKLDKFNEILDSWDEFDKQAAERDRESHNRKIAAFGRMIENSRAISGHLGQAIKTSEQLEKQFHDLRESNNASTLLNQGAFTTLATMTNNNNNQRGS